MPSEQAVRLKSGTVEIVRGLSDGLRLQAIGTYSSDEVERLKKGYETFLSALCAQYGQPSPEVRVDVSEEYWNVPGASKTTTITNGVLTIKNRFSMLTILDRTGRYLGKNEPREWARAIFAQAWPQVYSSLQTVNNALVDTSITPVQQNSTEQEVDSEDETFSDEEIDD